MKFQLFDPSLLLLLLHYINQPFRGIARVALALASAQHSAIQQIELVVESSNS